MPEEPEEREAPKDKPRIVWITGWFPRQPFKGEVEVEIYGPGGGVIHKVKVKGEEKE